MIPYAKLKIRKNQNTPQQIEIEETPFPILLYIHQSQPKYRLLLKGRGVTYLAGPSRPLQLKQ